MKATAKDYASLTLDERGLCDLELLAVGGFSPLTGFLGKADYDRVVAEKRLADGTLWPLPVTLPVTPGEGVAESASPWPSATSTATCSPSSTSRRSTAYDKEAEARGAYGTTDAKHPAVAYLNRQPSHYAAGRLEVIRVPPHYDFVELRRTPAELREHFESLGWSKVVAFQTRNPLHRAHEELTKRAAEQIGGGLLIHPVVGVTKPGDVDHYTRVRCYRALVDNYYEPGSVVLSLLPLAMRMAGPREVLLHAIIRRNYGCTHFIVGRDHAGPGNDSTGKPFYAPYAAQEAMAEHAGRDRHGDGRLQADGLPARRGPLQPGRRGPQGRQDGRHLGHPGPRQLPGQGPPPARVVQPPGRRRDPQRDQPAEVPPGPDDLVHRPLGLGQEHRGPRPGRAAGRVRPERLARSTATRSAPTSPRASASARKTATPTSTASATSPAWSPSTAGRRSARSSARIEAPATTPARLSKGNFVEVYCDTPIEVCEKRDVKGLYAKARNAVAEGKGMGFTGVDDPYEAPLNPEVTIDTSKLAVQECADAIIDKLLELGYILPHGHVTE